MAFREEIGTTVSPGAILLRQRRLRAAALGLTVWWGLILLQVLLAGRRWIEPAALVLTLGAASVLLSRRRADPPGPAAGTGVRDLRPDRRGPRGAPVPQHVGCDLPGDELMFHITLKNALIGSMTLMLAYAALIPNSWRLAAPVVSGSRPTRPSRSRAVPVASRGPSVPEPGGD